MGWTYTARPRHVRAEMTRKLCWETATHRSRCLDMALTLRVAYAAVETIEKATGQREVWAAVLLVDYVRRKDESYNFGVKEMDETMGPRECQCPERILTLLTPTDNETARQWRLACRARLNRPGMPPAGTQVRFAQPIKFRDGAEVSEFTVEKRGERRRRLRGANGGLYVLSRQAWRELEWTIVTSPVAGSAKVRTPERSEQLALLDNVSG